MLKHQEALKGAFPRTAAPSSEMNQLQTEVNEAVAEEVLPVAIAYLEENGFNEQIAQIGLDPEPVIDQIVVDINNASAQTPEQILSSFSINQSLSFQTFTEDIQYVIENTPVTSFESQINNLKNLYLNQITYSVEALAIINGCETAKSSFAYWNIETNTNYWDNVITENFDPTTLQTINTINNKTIPRRVSTDRRDIVVADAVGAIGGVIQGATIGAAAGSGGALVVGTAGMILRGAQASAGEYVLNKLKSWLFD
ncbi:MAG: hypothetical protein QM640_17160 [Niabella sp.]